MWWSNNEIFFVFSTGIHGSAICTFNMSSFNRAFSGPFKYQENAERAWTRVPNTAPPLEVGHRKFFLCLSFFLVWFEGFAFYDKSAWFRWQIYGVIQGFHITLMISIQGTKALKLLVCCKITFPINSKDKLHPGQWTWRRTPIHLFDYVSITFFQMCDRQMDRDRQMNS